MVKGSGNQEYIAIEDDILLYKNKPFGGTQEAALCFIDDCSPYYYYNNFFPVAFLCKFLSLFNLKCCIRLFMLSVNET